MKKFLLLALTALAMSCTIEEINVEDPCNCEIESFVNKGSQWKIWLTCISEPLALHKGDYQPEVGDCFDK